jgi:hypothetical protein
MPKYGFSWLEVISIRNSRKVLARLATAIAAPTKLM